MSAGDAVRRVFLAAVLVLFASPAFAQTASIAANRPSGVAPLAVRFDATGSDCNGNGTGGQWNEDLEQCLYSWDFGDPTAPDYEYGARARAGQPAPANEAHGFIAGHVFDAPGTYTVTLTIRNPSGGTATATQEITVSAFAGTTRCYATAAPFTGCPGGATQITQSNFGTAIANCVSNGANRCLFRRGDAFSSSGEVSPGARTIGAFGSGERPIVNGGASLIPGNDGRIMDVDFNGHTLSIGGVNHLLVYRARIRNSTDAGVGGYGSNQTGFYLVRSEVVDANGYGIYTMHQDTLIIGSRIALNGGASGTHNTRIGRLHKTVIASNEWGPAGLGNVLKLVGEGSACNTAQYLVLRDNVIIKDGTGFNIAVPLYPQGAGDDFAHGIDRVLVESNYWTGPGIGASGSRGAILLRQVPNLVVRNNIIDMLAGYANGILLESASAAISGCNPPQVSNASVRLSPWIVQIILFQSWAS